MISLQSILGQENDAAYGHDSKNLRAHLVGIAGAGMRSLADVLFEAGWQISGSDANCDAAIESRFAVSRLHQAAAIDPALHLVVHSEAVPVKNAELVRARKLGLPILTYPQVLGRLMDARSGVAVSGTHGKSTTTLMAAQILVTAGMDPTVVAGAAPVGAKSGGRLGRSRWMVAEACEYRSNFRFLKPQIAMVLGIEPDHFDCFRSPAELEQAFASFVEQVHSDGLVVARANCPVTQRVVSRAGCLSESFGLTAAATWQATSLRERGGFYCFEIRCRERLVCDVKLPVPGRHNVLNALAAAAVASRCGATGSMIRLGLERFGGIQRRLELVSQAGQIAILDDYAHHPTEVRAALATVRQMFPGRRVCCVFQPHQASRVKNLLDEFAHSLQNADEVIVAEIVRAREPAARAADVKAADLARRVAQLGAKVAPFEQSAEICHYLRNSLRPSDVLVTMGAGDIGNIAHELGQGFRSFRKAG